MVFKGFGFFRFKNLKRSDFLFFNVFLDIVVFFRINFALKPYGYYFFIIIVFSINMNLHSL